MNLRRWRQWFAQPVDGGSLAIVRMAVGVILFLEAIKLLVPSGGSDLLASYFLQPPFLFKYPGLDWVQPWTDSWMRIECGVLAAVSALLALGWWHRPAGIVAFAIWSHFLLLDVSRFNNHYYLEALLALLLAFTPADRRWSLAALLGRVPSHSRSVEFWSIFLIRGQLAVVYFWGGVAKLSPEWLLHGEPMRTLLRDPRCKLRAMEFMPDSWIHAAWPSVSSREFAYLLTYAGTAFDLAVIPLLIFRRTRLFGFVLAVLFHLANHFVLFDDIGFFPWLGLALTTIYFTPDWPSRLLSWLQQPRMPEPDWLWLVIGAVLLPPLGWLLAWKCRASLRRPAKGDPVLAAWATTIVLGWVLVQASLPALQFLMTESLLWTAKAEQFYWRMKSGVKIASNVRVEILDPEITRPPSSDGIPNIAWETWPFERVLYRSVDLSELEVREWPELFVEFQPLHGERILYNPQSRFGTRGRAGVIEFWKRKHGRLPRLTRTESLTNILKAIRTALAAKVDATTLTRIEMVQSVVQRIEGDALDPIYQRELLESVRSELRDLCLDGNLEVGQFVQSSLQYLQPESLTSVDPPRGIFFLVEDVALYQPSAKRYRGAYTALVRNPISNEPTDPLEVMGDFERLTPRELSYWPQLRLESDAGGSPSILWNPYGELIEHQWLIAFTQPQLCRQYAIHVADVWEDLQGRRSPVHMTVCLAVAPYREQPLLDPQRDLTQTEWHIFGTNDWIEPFERTVDENRFQRLDALEQAVAGTSR